jgi:hypothetical protein
MRPVCEHCRHWNNNHGIPERSGWGKCTRAAEFGWRFESDRYERPIPDGIALEGDQFFTGPRFGCIYWEGKE